MMSTAWTGTASTPDGSFTVLGTADHVLASGWTDDVAALAALVHPTLRPQVDEIHATADRTSGPLASAFEAVDRYYDGDLHAPARVPVLQHSGEFRVHAWNVLREVAPGATITYSRYADRAGRPAAVRAAAAACAMNAAALFVPCHRVLRTDGSLGGFRYGLPLKQRLLDREGEPVGTLF